jgi:hypothetical protein
MVGEGAIISVDDGTGIAVVGVVGFSGVWVACGRKSERAQAMDENKTTIGMNETRDLIGCLFIIIGSFVLCAPF